MSEDGRGRFVLAWLSMIASVLAIVAVVAIVMATLDGHLEPLIGAVIAVLLFGPVFVAMARK